MYVKTRQGRTYDAFIFALIPQSPSMASKQAFKGTTRIALGASYVRHRTDHVLSRCYFE